MSRLIVSLTTLLAFAVVSISQGLIPLDAVTRAVDALPLTIIQAWPSKYTGIS